MLLPHTVDVPMKRLPIANWVLIAATIIIGFPCWSNPREYLMDVAMSGSPPFYVLLRGDWFHWTQLVGMLFGHAGIVHLLGNMWMLYIFGKAVNAKIGHVAYLALYFTVGVAQALIWLAFGSGEATLGASGAVMGMVGAFLVLYPHNNVSIFYWFGFAMGSFEISAYFVIAAYVALDLLGTLGGDSGTNHLAHLAGAGVGFGIMMAANAIKLVRADPGEITMLDIFKGKRVGGQDRSLRGASNHDSFVRRGSGPRR